MTRTLRISKDLSLPIDAVTEIAPAVLLTAIVPKVELDPLLVERQASKILMRFWLRVDRNGPVPSHCPEIGPCWLWIGGKRNGYGILWLANHMVYAHRLSYVAHHEPLPLGDVVCHRCDFPLCVRPSHVFPGTRADNNADMRAKGRERKVGPKGFAHPRAHLTDADALEVRRLRKSGIPQRTVASRFKISQNTVWQVFHGLGRFAFLEIP